MGWDGMGWDGIMRCVVLCKKIMLPLLCVFVALLCVWVPVSFLRAVLPRVLDLGQKKWLLPSGK